MGLEKPNPSGVKQLSSDVRRQSSSDVEDMNADVLDEKDFSLLMDGTGAKPRAALLAVKANAERTRVALLRVMVMVHSK